MSAIDVSSRQELGGLPAIEGLNEAKPPIWKSAKFRGILLSMAVVGLIAALAVVVSGNVDTSPKDLGKAGEASTNSQQESCDFCDLLEVSVHCDNNLTVRFFEGDILLSTQRKEDYYDHWQWKTPFRSIYEVTPESRLEFECTDVGVVGGFIGTVKACGRTYTTRHSLEKTKYNFYVVEQRSEITEPMQFTPLGEGRWAYAVNQTSTDIDSDAIWVWDSSTMNTITFGFDAGCNSDMDVSTDAPATAQPTPRPTLEPTLKPTAEPTESPTPQPTFCPHCDEATITAYCDNNLTVRVYEGDLLVLEDRKHDYHDHLQWRTPYHRTISVTPETHISFECIDLHVVGGFLAKIDACGETYYTNETTASNTDKYNFYIESASSLQFPLVYTNVGEGAWAGYVKADSGFPADSKWVWDSQIQNTITFGFDFGCDSDIHQYVEPCDCREADIYLHCDNNLTVSRYEMIGGHEYLTSVEYHDEVYTHWQWINPFHRASVHVNPNVRYEFQCIDLGVVGGFIAQVSACGTVVHTTNQTSVGDSPFQWNILESKSNIQLPLQYTILGEGQWQNQVNPGTSILGENSDIYWVWDSQTHNTMTFGFDFSCPAY